MDVASAIVGPVVTVLTGHITQKLRNLTSSADRVKKMIKRMEVLDGQRVDNENRMKANNGNNKEIPVRVPGWLKEVENIKKEVEKLPSNDIGCFNVKRKYLAGRNALRVTEDIEGLIEESKGIIWSDAQIPLGRVDSKRPASTSTSTSGGNTQIVFKSRDKIFDDALKFLQHDNDKTRVVALCGMGGVGKTTLMKQLKKVAHDNKIFNWIVDVPIGKSSNLFKIQEVIAAHTGESLTKTDETLRATLLSKRFQAFSERKETSLVIFDDVWEKIKLEDIGLAGPLPNGVKLLLTSRDQNICQQIAVDAGSVLQAVRVDVLEEEEARDFFCQIAEISAEDDHDLYQIGCDIVKKCGYLPLAINLIAATLRCQSKIVWKRTLKCLKKNMNVLEFVDISYKNLEREEDKAIFRLCGMFPEDSNIPIEDLTRYAWGLTLLKQVYTIEDARECTQTSVSNLKNAFLLMDGDSDDYECVKMHDLVLAFVVNTVSKDADDGCWIIHHDDFSKLSEANNMSQSCKQLSLTCMGMSEFPSEIQFPNLSLLKIMHGDESLRAPQDFYATMEKLQVIAFERMEYAFVPTSFQCSTNLRTLCLHECSLLFDLSCIGNILNLEVLSFANSCITIIPFTFGNLKKLRLLDVTGCYNLVIDDGVLKSLVKLEELYMRGHALCFTDNNSSELAERSQNLRALELEFVGDNAHMKNMSYEKLQRFKLSVGCYFSEVRGKLGRNKVDAHSYQNSLKLITNEEELEKSNISELFMNTDALYLQVNDMNTLPYSSFSNLRLLVVSNCGELTYLFTPSVATTLSKLEYLEISGCPIMEAVCNGSDIIKFSNLKYLRMADLPKLLSFSNSVNVIKLPHLMELHLEGLQSLTSIYPDSATTFVSSNITPAHSFFNVQDAAPKLEKLVVSDMENLKEMWPPQFSISNLCPLRELTVKGCGSIEVLFNMDFGEMEQHSSSLRSIKVKGCDSLVKLFSCNPFPFLNNLQKLYVESCGSIQVLFNTDLERAGKSEELVCSSSLRSIQVKGCDSLVKLFSCNPFPFLNNLQELQVRTCGSIQVLFDIDSGRAGKMEELVCSSSLRSIEVLGCDSLVNLLPCNPMSLFNHLEELVVISCRSIQVLFDIDSGHTGNIGEQVCSSSLRSIKVARCDSLVNLLPSNPLPLFNHLEELDVEFCGSIEVIFDIDMECVVEMDKVSSSRLRRIWLEGLGKLREVWRIKGVESIRIKRCENLIHGFEAVESIRIKRCERFENLITPATPTFDMRGLKQVEIKWCGRQSERKNELVESNQDQEIKVISSSTEEVNDDISKVALPSSLLPTFHNLHQLVLWDYKAMEVVFEITTPSSRESPHNTQQPPILPYLEVLELMFMERMSHVWKCDWNEFLILQKPQSQSSFHNLTTISMYQCNNIKYLFSPLMAKLLSNLKKIYISFCDGIEEIVSNRDDEDVSIYSHTTTTFFPHLNILELYKLRNFKCIGGGANGISSDIHDQLQLSQASWSWSLCQYAREISIRDCDALSSVIPWYAVGQTQKLQVLEVINCKSMTEVFETQEINNKSGTDTGKSLPRLEYITMLKLPKLKILKIQGCNLLKHIFTFSTLESLAELEELEIKDCEAMEVIVMEENGEQTTASDVVVFPHLKSLSLVDLPNVVGFFLGRSEFIWRALEKVVIGECPQLTVFTYGRSTAPKVNFIITSLGKHSVECGLNFRVTNTSHQAQLPSYESTSSYRPTTMERLPWSYHNLIEVDTVYNTSGCRWDIEEIFDSQTVGEIPNLRQVELVYLKSLKYIWKSKQGTVLKFPNLTRLSIVTCNRLEYVFTCPMVGSLLQLQELHISRCESMKVIVKGEEEEKCDAIVNAILVFPRLKSLKLEWLESLEGFCIGKEDFEFPSLDTLQIDMCWKLTVFTKGDLSAPKLYAISSIEGSNGKYNIHNRLNSLIKDFTL